MNTRAIIWLSKTSRAFGNLPREEKEEIIDFALLWSFFEGTKLDQHGSIAAIRTYVETLSQQQVDTLSLDHFITYFQNRYTENDGFSYRYQHLHLDESRNPEEVNRMLLREANDSRENLVGCLGVIYRYRNNFFHGVKWEYDLEEQHSNFVNANTLLLKLLELDS